MGIEAPGPPARHRNGAAGRSVERARGRVWSSLGTTMRIEQDVTEKVMMEGQLGKPRSHVQILELPPLLGIDIGNGLKTNEQCRNQNKILIVLGQKVCTISAMLKLSLYVSPARTRDPRL